MVLNRSDKLGFVGVGFIRPGQVRLRWTGFDESNPYKYSIKNQGLKGDFLEKRE